jgi:hypothetical protein
VKSYRIYVVARDGRLQLGAAFQARDDNDAASRAKLAAPAGQAAELWEAGRLVGRLGEDGGFSPER